MFQASTTATGVRMHRQTYDRELVGQRFLELLKTGKRIGEVCRDMRIGRATIWRWAKEDPEKFGHVLDEAYHHSQIQRLGPTPPEMECAYAAGFFDGEGTIGIRRGHFAKSHNRRWYQLYAGVVNTNVAIVEWFCGRWKGIVSHSPPSAPTSKPSDRWQLSGVNAQKFLVDVLPHLLVKRPQAELGLAFQDFVELGQMGRTDEDYEKIFQFHVQMRHLNQKGTKPVVILTD